MNMWRVSTGEMCISDQAASHVSCAERPAHPPSVRLARSVRSRSTAASSAPRYCTQLQRPPGKSCAACARNGSLRSVRPLKPSAARAASSRRQLQGQEAGPEKACTNQQQTLRAADGACLASCCL